MLLSRGVRLTRRYRVTVLTETHAVHWGIEDMAVLYEKLYLNLLATLDTLPTHACNLLTAERNPH